MNEYEIMLLLDPELSEERGNEIIQRLRDSVDGSGGSWDGHEPWGRRRLAYEIDHKAEAVYHLLLFSTTAEALAEITRVLKITDGVVRHLAVRRVQGGHLKAPAQIPAPEPVSEPIPEPEPVAETLPEPVEETLPEPVEEPAPEAAAVAATEAPATAATADDTDGGAE